jgi:hypothetical protein
VEDWSQIRVLARREGLSQRTISPRLGISRVTVKRALVSEGPPGYERGPRSSGFDAFEAQVMPFKGFLGQTEGLLGLVGSWPGKLDGPEPPTAVVGAGGSGGSVGVQRW